MQATIVSSVAIDYKLPTNHHQITTDTIPPTAMAGAGESSSSGARGPSGPGETANGGVLRPQPDLQAMANACSTIAVQINQMRNIPAIVRQSELQLTQLKSDVEGVHRMLAAG